MLRSDAASDSRISRNGPAGSIATTSRARADKLERQPARARGHLDDPVKAARQPLEYAGVQPLGTDQPVVELRFEAVEELPGQGDVGSRVAGCSPDKSLELRLR